MPPFPYRRFLPLLILIAAVSAAPHRAQNATAGWHPVTVDRPKLDQAHPPASVSFRLATSGAQVNAMFYLAAGAGPHATVLLLHGRPGNERHFALAQALRRAGYHVRTMNYRGSWGNGGVFSFGYDFLRELTTLRDRPVLLMAGTRDKRLPMALHHEPIDRALRNAGAKRIATAVFDDDHAFSPPRIAMMPVVVDWFRKTVAP